MRLARSVIAALLLIWPASSIAEEAAPFTDANLVTALDVSASIMRHEEWLEVEGLAKAVVSGAVLDAIAGGEYGRIGFAVHTWSSGGRFEIVVPWTLIASPGDAEGVGATRPVATIPERNKNARLLSPLFLLVAITHASSTISTLRLVMTAKLFCLLTLYFIFCLRPWSSRRWGLELFLA